MKSVTQPFLYSLLEINIRVSVRDKKQASWIKEQTNVLNYPVDEWK